MLNSDRIVSALALLALVFSVTACGSADPACGENGQEVAGACECGEGFSTSNDGLSCVPQISTGGSSSTEMVDMGELAFAPTDIRGATTNPGEPGIWVLAASERDVLFRIEILESFGGLTSPGEMTFDESETSYKTCGSCAVLRTGCEIRDSQLECERAFMPLPGGEMHVRTIGSTPGDQFVGEFHDMTFQEVEIADDFTTEPVSGGQVWSLEDWSFDVQLEVIDGPDVPDICGGHGHVHGSQCHCNSGYRTDPNDSLNCIPQ